ncbi:hypothetical protein [Yellowstone lake phycodnavirus 3]|uniref:tail fiber protein n=1 Tax=Yellowstone lake phycodnavirus 3 TaxID=1586715 RepID=UPI0006EB3E85|nr:tail fiber protein [Yellowstone lake phycodnavirus 3]BAT22664.1 hypothetical protein [Yellowstone lake phycodnavirus 3]
MSETLFYGSKNLVGVGSVGIGTTNPSAPLAILSNIIHISNTFGLQITCGGGIALGSCNGGPGLGHWYIVTQATNRDNGAGPYFDYGNQGDLIFNRHSGNLLAAAMVEAMRINGTSGNIGIGTTNPAVALDVYTGTMNASSVTATSLSGGGSAITSLNMANAASGTLAVARGGTGVTASTGTGSVVLSASPSFTGSVAIGLASAVDMLDVYASQDTVRMARFCNTKNNGGSQDTCFVHTDQTFSTAVTAWTGSALTVTTYPQNNSTNNGYIAKFGTSASDGTSMEPKVVISSGYNTLGFVGIGTTNPAYALEVVGTFRTSTTMTFSGGSGGGVRYVQVDNNGTVSYLASDARLKTNITPISYGLDAVLQLNPVTFNWKDSNVGGAYTDMGFIAQEVEPIIPEVVRVDSDGVYSLNLPNINAVLTKAIQELSTKNTDLEAKLQTAQNDIDLLESRLAAIEALIGTNTSADTGSAPTGTRAEGLLSQV